MRLSLAVVVAVLVGARLHEAERKVAL